MAQVVLRVLTASVRGPTQTDSVTMSAIQIKNEARCARTSSAEKEDARRKRIPTKLACFGKPAKRRSINNTCGIHDFPVTQTWAKSFRIHDMGHNRVHGKCSQTHGSQTGGGRLRGAASFATIKPR